MESRESELRAQLDRLETMGTDWLKSLKRPDSSSKSIVNISAGSWVGVTLMIAAAFVLGYSLASSMNLSREMSTIEAKQVDQGDKLDAIYMMAPQLKPK